MLLHIGSKWRWDFGDGAGNSQSVQLPFLPPLLFHSPPVPQHVWEIPSQALSLLHIPALCPACGAQAQHRSSPSLSEGGFIALTPQPSIGSRSTALGLELNPITSIIPKGTKEGRGKLSAAHTGRDPRQAHLSTPKTWSVLGGGSCWGRSQPVPLQSPPWGPGGDALWDRMGCLSPDPAF